MKRHNVCKRHVARCQWHWCQTNWTYHFSPRYFKGIRIETALKCSIFEETMPKLSVNFGNHYLTRLSQETTCNFGLTAPQYSDKCWSNLPQKCRMFLIGNTHWSYRITCAITWFMVWLVCLEPVTMCWCRSIINWRHHCTSVCSKSNISEKALPNACWTHYYKWMQMKRCIRLTRRPGKKQAKREAPQYAGKFCDMEVKIKKYIRETILHWIDRTHCCCYTHLRNMCPPT